MPLGFLILAGLIMLSGIWGKIIPEFSKNVILALSFPVAVIVILLGVFAFGKSVKITFFLPSIAGLIVGVMLLIEILQLFQFPLGVKTFVGISAIVSACIGIWGREH